MKKHFLSLFFLLLLFGFSFTVGGCKEPANTNPNGTDSLDTIVAEAPKTIVGADVLISKKLHFVHGKKIAIVANHSTLLGNGTHLVDTLHSLGNDIRKVFAPEHGFRGDHDAGARVSHDKDEKTGIPIISLYGKNKKPAAEQLKDVEIVLFDLQDVGARFYTYISTLTYVMEACAENNKQLIILDRPNPNGWYVNGPVLNTQYKSFIGMHPIPIVHGMTMAEFGQMVNGEKWLENNASCNLTVISCEHYTHKMRWSETGLPWIPPSPNLATEYSAYLYPILCWYERMPVSVGRGTDSAFAILGAPWHEGYKYTWQKDSVLGNEDPAVITLYGLQMESYRFTPVSIPGKSTYPKFENELCWGIRFKNRVGGDSLFLAGLQLLKNFEEESRNVGFRKPIFQNGFEKISGTSKLREQVLQGMRPEEILPTWDQELAKFKGIRKKYLLYADFE